MPGKAYSRGVRQLHIVNIFKDRVARNKGNEMTAVSIAKLLMIEPSWHLRNILAEMVRDGYLKSRFVDDATSANLKNNTGKKCWYSLGDKELEKMEEEARDVPVKTSGKIVGQLRLF